MYPLNRPEVMIPGGKAIAELAIRIIEQKKPDFVVVDKPPTLNSPSARRERAMAAARSGPHTISLASMLS